METKKLKDDKNGIKTACEILKNGGIVAVPTETVYGLAANCYDEDAVKKIFKAKGRPQDNPLIVHICDMEMLKDIAREIPEIALKCAEKFWPGPFTMILPKTEKIGDCISPNLDTVAIRLPDNEITAEIIRQSGLPLAAPSANRSGSPSPTTPEHVWADLEGRIDAVVYSDECSVGVESTVVTFCEQPPRLLRPGGITPEQLRGVIPDIVLDKAVLAEPEKGKQVASPGMKYKHYAPKTESFLVEGESDAFSEFVNSKSDSVAICFKEDLEKIKIPTLCYGEAKSEETLAHSVFAALREVDEMGAKEVYIHAPTKTGIGLAVYNRLLRASGFKVITL
ncbi:MAG: threonylcarbamoyl-AMP synthase [Clostridia bacterium]|nr:threonylcarbamoyl-AMP synthase [Clostridia bacterium]